MWSMGVGLAFVLISILAGTLIGWGLRVKNFDLGKDAVGPGYKGRELSLTVSVSAVDSTAGTMTMFWVVVADSCPSNCSDTDIFINDSVQSRNVSTTPIIRWLPSDHQKHDFFDGFACKTVTSMIPNSGSQSNSFQNYPFDVYFASINLLALEVGTNAHVGLKVVSSDGIAVGFHLKPDLTIPNSVAGEIRAIIHIDRGALVKAYAIVIVIAVWIVTLVFVFITFYSAVGGYPQPRELLVVPVATLFTVTQLRATMPGAPTGFGAIIDYVALLPCLSLMIICAATEIAFLAFWKSTAVRRTFLDRILSMGNRKDKQAEPDKIQMPSSSTSVHVGNDQDVQDRMKDASPVTPVHVFNNQDLQSRTKEAYPVTPSV